LTCTGSVASTGSTKLAACRMKFLHDRVEFLKVPAADRDVGACLR
jgi:hypothetical protein